MRPLAEDLREHDAAAPRNNQSETARAEGKTGIGPSDYGRCRAQIGYRERPPDDYTPDPVSKDAAIVGTLIDEGIKARRAKLYPDRLHDLEVDVAGLDQPGHLDEYDPQSKTVVDFKTAGDWVWERVSTGKVDGMPADWGQVAVYALALRASGRPVEKLRLVYLWRDKGTSVEFERDYDEAEALAAVGWLHDVVDALDAGAEPRSPALPRDRKGPGLDPICSKWCPAVRHCWQLDDVPEGRSPQSYVVVGDDAEKAAVCLAAFGDAQVEAAKAKTRLDEVKAALTGLPEGVYPGGLLLEWAGGSKGRWVDDPEGSVTALREKVAELHARVLEGEFYAGLDADTWREPTEEERVEWLRQGREAADGIVLPQKLTGKRAASPKVTRTEDPVTVERITT